MFPAIVDWLSEGLRRLNLIVAAITMLMAVSLAAYLVFYHGRSRAARAFAALLALLTWISLGDLFLSTSRLEAAHPAAAFWLRFQWLGIAFVAPVYLWFSDAVRSSLGEGPGARRAVTLSGLALGLLALLAVLRGDLLVSGPVGQPGALRLAAGPLFGAFGLVYWLLCAWAAWGLRRAAGRSRQSRPRMLWLAPSLVAPVYAFPWLSLVPAAQAPSPTAFRLFITLANIGTATLLLVVAYSLAFQGTLVPDRAIKRELAKYLIQTILPGACILATAQLVPERLQQSLGLPRDLVFMVATVFGIVGYQIVVRLLKPMIDRLIYGSGSADAIWLRRLDERLLTGEDLSQLLNGILAALCELWRVDAGGILAVVDDRPTLDLWSGDAGMRGPLLEALDGPAVASIVERGGFQPLAGFLCRALRDDEGAARGLLVLAAPAAAPSPQVAAETELLVSGAERALADRAAQQRVLAALRALEPELTRMQQLRGRSLQETPADLAEGLSAAAEAADSDELVAWVREALAHYWGGPKLTESPLLRLRLVREALNRNEGNAAKAMRAVLDQALERLKPDGDRSLTASQWMLYNILELKFVRGLKVRDIAVRLAMSESDLYRKQRVAIEALAEQLAALDQGPTETETTAGAAAQAAAGAGPGPEPDPGSRSAAEPDPGSPSSSRPPTA